MPSHILAHEWLFLIINYYVLLLTLSHPYSHMSFVGGILFHIYPNISLCWALRHPYPMCVHGSLQLCYHHPSMSFWCICAIPIRICVFVWLSTFLIAFCLLLELSNTLLPLWNLISLLSLNENLIYQYPRILSEIMSSIFHIPLLWDSFVNLFQIERYGLENCNLHKNIVPTDYIYIYISVSHTSKCENSN